MSKASNYEKKSTSSLNDIISLNTKLSKNLKDNIKHIVNYYFYTIFYILFIANSSFFFLI